MEVLSAMPKGDTNNEDIFGTFSKPVVAKVHMLLMQMSFVLDF